MTSRTSEKLWWLRGLAALVAVLLGGPAQAIPRFAARNGMECIQCHVNPTGGGMRNEYGRNVFENTFLPWSAKRAPPSWLAPSFEASKEGEAGDGSTAEIERTSSGFSPDLTEWLTIGADARLAYLLIRPDRRAAEAAHLDVTSSFFLMQGDLYHAARINERFTLYLDVGIYSGFEVWALARLTRLDAPFTLYAKAGRFLPPFGIREVEHQLFTREGVGFGGTDRDTGLELDAYWGPVTWSTAVVNGTLGDTAFDTAGSQRRTFEKAVSSRLSARAVPLGFRAQLGGSFYWSDNNAQTNPLLASSVPATANDEVKKGATEVRAGAFLTLNRGRFTYLADAAWVENRFTSEALSPLRGYATYQELSFVPTQGLELVGTYEFMDPDVEVLHNATHRAGVVMELFPLPFTEVRAMVRRTFGDLKAGPRWDAVLFLHLFM